MVICWYNNHQNIEPNYGLTPIYSPKLQCMISVGSYVLINGNGVENWLKTTDDNVVARVTFHDHRTDYIYCNILPLLTRVEHSNDNTTYNSQYPVAVPYNSIQTGVAAGITEVAASNYCLVATRDDIEDVAFVFHIIDYIHGRVYGQGVKNCFLLRYIYKNGLIDTQTPLQYVSCFPSYYVEHKHFRRCSIFILWSKITELQVVLWKILNKYSEKEENTTILQFPFDELLWSYLINRTKGILEERELLSDGTVRCFTLKGMIRETMRTGPQRITSILRFQTESQLECLRKILGDATTIGIRMRRPKLYCKSIVQPNDTLNIIIGSELNRKAPFQINTNTSRIDFIKNDNNNDSYIFVKYENYKLSSNSKLLLNKKHENILNHAHVKYMMNSQH